MTTSRFPRVLLVTFLSVPSGVRSNIFDTAKALHRRGIHVDLAAADDCQPDMAAEWKSLTGRAPLLDPAFSNKRLEEGRVTVADARLAFALAIAKSNADVVHIHRLLGFQEVLIEALEGLARGRGIVHSNHDMYGVHLRAPGADVELHVSNYVRRGLVHQTGRLSGTRDFVIHPFVGDEFSPDGPIDEFVDTCPGFKVGIVSRLAFGKGLDVAAEGFVRFREAMLNVGRPTSFIVCHPPIRSLAEEAESVRSDIWRILENGGAAANTRFIERERGPLPPVYRSLDATWHPAVPFISPDSGAPSVPISEAFALTPLEARRCGTPALSSDDGGQPESVPSRFKKLLVVRPGDAQALADQTLQLALDPVLYRQVAEECARDAADRFSPERAVDELLKAYTVAGLLSHTSRDGSKAPRAIAM